MKARSFWVIGFITATSAGFLVWNGKIDALRIASIMRNHESNGGREDAVKKQPPSGTTQPIKRSEVNNEDYERVEVRMNNYEEGMVADPAMNVEREHGVAIMPESMNEKIVNHSVPFQSQAPFADWSQPWEDACEEASLVLANRYARGIETLSKEEMRDEILRLVEYQNNTYGDYKDSDAARTAEIGRGVYELDAEVKNIKNVEEIITALARESLVIAPMAGRLLGNPYFTPPGPFYHMVVIKGYDPAAGEFIAHDIGTRRGSEYRYRSKTVWNALHDFPGDKERIEEGAKRIIVVNKFGN